MSNITGLQEVNVSCLRKTELAKSTVSSKISASGLANEVASDHFAFTFIFTIDLILKLEKDLQ